MEIKFQGATWYENADGFFLALRTKDRATAARFCSELKDGKSYKAKLTEDRKGRSLDSNSYMWVLLDKLAAKTGKGKTELYKALIKDVGGCSDIVQCTTEAAPRFRDMWEAKGLGWLTDTLPSNRRGCINIICYYGSSTFDAAQMHRLLELVIQECKQQEIETMTPDELARLLDREDR